MLTTLRDKYRQLDFDTYNNHMLVVFAFFLPFYEEGVRFVLMIILFFTLLRGEYLEKLKKALSNKVVLAFSLYFLLHVVGLLWTDDLDRGLYFLGEMKYFLIPLFFYSFLRYEYVSKILTAFLVGMFFSEIYAYGIFLEILNWTFTGKLHDPTPFMNHLNYSLFLVFTLIVLFYRVISNISVKKRVFYTVFFFASLGNLVIMQGRIGYLLFFVGTTIVLYQIFNKKVIHSLTIGSLIIITGSILAYNYSSSFHKRVNQSLNSLKHIEKGNYNSSWGMRIANFIVCKDVFLEQPIIGVGTGGQLAAMKEKLNEEYNKFKFLEAYPHLHSSYNDAMIQFGVLGVILFLFILYAVYRQRQDDLFLRSIRILLLIILIIFNIADVSFGEVRNGNAIQFIFFMTMITLTLSVPQKGSDSVQTIPKKYFYPLLILTIFLASKLNWYIGHKKVELLLPHLQNGKFFKTSRYQYRFFSKKFCK